VITFLVTVKQQRSCLQAVWIDCNGHDYMLALTTNCVHTACNLQSYMLVITSKYDYMCSQRWMIGWLMHRFCIQMITIQMIEYIACIHEKMPAR